MNLFTYRNICKFRVKICSLCDLKPGFSLSLETFRNELKIIRKTREMLKYAFGQLNGWKSGKLVQRENCVAKNACKSCCTYLLLFTVYCCCYLVVIEANKLFFHVDH